MLLLRSLSSAKLCCASHASVVAGAVAFAEATLSDASFAVTSDLDVLDLIGTRPCHVRWPPNEDLLST